MSKTLTIELPDNLSEQLRTLADSADESLEKLVLQTLQVLATSMQSLQEANPAIRANAAKTLWVIGAETAIPALGQALHDKDSSVRQCSAEALQLIGTESALALLAQQQSEQSLASCEDEAFDPITPLIGTLHLGPTDLAENHDHYLAEALERELTAGA